MELIEIAFIGISLSMDALAVSLSKGLTSKKINLKKAIIIGLYFGTFQALMPLIGYLLGSSFQEYIEEIDHWVAFVALSLIGTNMIKESFKNNEEVVDDSIDFKNMIILSIATSIDALVVGVTFGFLEVNIIEASSMIGLITFIISVLGVIIGHRVGNKLGNKANILGGIVLILFGCKLLLEHLDIFCKLNEKI